MHQLKRPFRHRDWALKLNARDSSESPRKQASHARICLSESSIWLDMLFRAVGNWAQYRDGVFWWCAGRVLNAEDR